MSENEPKSAYSVFLASRKKLKNKKMACNKAGNIKGRNKNQTKTSTPAIKSKNKYQNSKESIKPDEVVSLVEQLMHDGADGKKLTKAEQKKKTQLENYLIKQLEKDDEEMYNRISSNEEDTFDSEEDDEEEEECSEEDDDSDVFSDEYTINDTTATTSGSTNTTSTTQSSLTDERDERAAQQLADAILNRRGNNKKRKSETNTSKGNKGEVVETVKNVKGSMVGEKAKKLKLVTKEEETANSKKSINGGQLPKTCSRFSNGAAKPKEISATVTSTTARKSTSEAASTSKVAKTCLRLSNDLATKPISKKANVKLEPLSPVSNIVTMNSIEEGKRAFKWLLNPIKIDEFFGKYWETTACLIKRQNNANYYSHLISFKDIDQMLLKNHIEFTKNLDITSYKNGQRFTMSLEGRALPPVVWDHYDQGCSLRLLNPQTFLSSLHSLNATLQEYFHCLVGTNVYLTPPNSQGFAPHYDDIEAFVLQIEGRKRWKLYKPRSPAELLPRYSSQNFSQDEIGEPILEEVLEPGDLLYFPRGTIHQASTETGHHSLHITLSVYQRQSYGDLLEKMLPIMLRKAITTQLDLRKGLPLNIWQNAGIAFSELDTKERADFQKKIKQLVSKTIRDMPLTEIIDHAVDQMAKKFQHEALPPDILPGERIRTIFGSQSHANERGECMCDYDIDERTNVRLLRANIVRLVQEANDEEEKIRLYYYLDNSKEYCQYDLNYMEIDPLQAASIEVLIKSYPAYVGVAELPMPDSERKVQLVTALWEKGLLMMEKPLV